LAISGFCLVLHVRGGPIRGSRHPLDRTVDYLDCPNVVHGVMSVWSYMQIFYIVITCN
jgi:hypothetical protein